VAPTISRWIPATGGATFDKPVDKIGEKTISQYIEPTGATAEMLRLNTSIAMMIAFGARD